MFFSSAFILVGDKLISIFIIIRVVGLDGGNTFVKLHALFLFFFLPNLILLVGGQLIKVIVLVQVEQENEPLVLIDVHFTVLYFLVDVIDLLDLFFEQLVNELWQESDIHVMLQIWEHFGPQLIEFVQSLLFDFEAFFA